MTRDTALSAVFDCMLYLQAAISEDGPASELVRHAECGNISLFVSGEILQEIRNVLSRPRAVAKYPFLTSEFIEAYLTRVARFAKFVTTFPPSFSYSRDPKDEKYINLAIQTEARYLVSRDKDLLDLVTDHTNEAKEFRQRFRQLKIVDPVEFLQIIRKLDLSLEP